MESYTLPNGLRVLLVPMPGVQSTAIGVYVGTGSRYENPDINGISHFAEQLSKFTSRIHRTDLEGTIEVVSDGKTFWVK